MSSLSRSAAHAGDVAVEAVADALQRDVDALHRTARRYHDNDDHNDGVIDTLRRAIRDLL